MARSASSLFSLEARGKLAGLQVSHRPHLGQVVTTHVVPPDPATPKQLQYRARHALLTRAWHTYLANPISRYRWDRLRRYRGRPGTAYSEYLHDNLIPLVGAPAVTIYEDGLSRTLLPGFLVFVCWISNPMPIAVADWGPAPTFPRHTTSIGIWPEGFWLGLAPDIYPSKRVFCRFRSIEPFSSITIGYSGLSATTTYG